MEVIVRRFLLSKSVCNYLKLLCEIVLNFAFVFSNEDLKFFNTTRCRMKAYDAKSSTGARGFRFSQNINDILYFISR